MFSVTALAVLPLKDYPPGGIFPPSTARLRYSWNPETSHVCFSVFRATKRPSDKWNGYRVRNLTLQCIIKVKISFPKERNPVSSSNNHDARYASNAKKA